MYNVTGGLWCSRKKLRGQAAALDAEVKGERFKGKAKFIQLWKNKVATYVPLSGLKPVKHWSFNWWAFWSRTVWDMSYWQPNDNLSFSNKNNVSALYIHWFVKAHVLCKPICLQVTQWCLYSNIQPTANLDFLHVSAVCLEPFLLCH